MDQPFSFLLFGHDPGPWCKMAAFDYLMVGSS